MKIGFIGLGSMAKAIIQGILISKAKINSKDILVHSQHADNYKNYAQAYQLTPISSNQELIDQSDLIVLALLPKVADKVISQLTFPTNRPVISVISGFDLQHLSELTNPDQPILRTLPNVNSEYGLGMTAYCANPTLKSLSEQFKKALQVFSLGGEVIELSEAQFPSFSAISGSGVAYIDYFIECMSKAGVKYGLSKQQAIEIVSQTMLGSAKVVIESKQSPTDIIDKVSSPGGDTIKGLLKMEQKGFLNAVIKGIDATVESANKISK